MAACLDRAAVLGALSEAASSGAASLPGGAAELSKRACEDYAHALGADPGNREARSTLDALGTGG